MHDAGSTASGRASTTARRRGRIAGNALLAFASLLISILAIEAGFRVVNGVPMFEFANWRGDRTVILESGDLPVPDPVLGWVSRPGYVGDGYRTLAHGIRRNFDETEIRTGEILAVGDSFTEGMEVDDDQSWPAYLEKKIGRPVVNGGVMAYGTDQIILRTEQLLPIVKPKILIVGFLEFDVFRTGHSHFGSPKPFFTIENGALRYHSPPLVTVRSDGGFFVGASYKIRHLLGYFASIDFLLHRLAPDFWLGSEKRQYVRAPNDPLPVTCLLLERLKQRTDREGVRLILFLQYYALAIMEDDEPTPNAQGVAACAKQYGIQVVDHFAPLRALVEKDADAMRPLYMTDGKNFTHMSPKGNEHAAQVLAKALGE